MSHRCSRSLMASLIILTVAVLVMPSFAARQIGPFGEGPKPSSGGAYEEGGSGAQGDASATATSPFQQARALARAGKYQEALPLAEKALSISEKQWEPDDPRIGNALELLGNIRMGLFHRRIAISLYQRALSP